MLGKLFKRSSGYRAEDVKGLSAKTDEATLRELLSHANAEIRAAAVRQLADPLVAAQCWRDATDETVRAAAETVLTAQLNDQVDAVLENLADWPIGERLQLVRQHAPLRVERWLNGLDESVCLDLAVHAPLASDRHQAAEQLNSMESLQALQKAAKGHDKALYRLAKTRLQNLRAVDEARAEREASLEHVRLGLEKLIHTTSDPLLEGKLTHLMHRLESLQPDERERALVEPLHQQITRRLEQERAAESAQQEAVADAEANRLADHVLIQQAEQQVRDQLRFYLSEGRLLPEEYGGWTEWLEMTLNDYRAAVDSTEADPALKNKLQETSERYHQVLQALLEITVDWGNMAAAADAMTDDGNAYRAIGKLVSPLRADLTLWPDELQQLHTRWQRLQQAAKDSHEEEKKQVQSVRGLIRRGQGAVKGGHLRQARGIWRTIQEHLEQLSAQGHEHLREQAEEFHAEMEKLADWQDFAVLPKKEELIAHMKALAERTMHPQDKADAVQALQKEWRKLSQGGGGKHQELWEQFHQLAEAAYAPCKEYFAEQDELHALNYKKRLELIGQLHQYHATNDWHDPDWAEVEKVLRLAARDWRQFTPVKPREHRETEKQYHAAVNQIREQLNQEYDRNKAERESIIAEAEQLRDVEDIKRATEQLKDLQRAWKQAGRTHRKDDQALWKAFRSICDELFARRDEASQALRSELDQHLSAALAIIKRIEAAANSDDDAVVHEALSQLSDWEAEFDAVGELPKARLEETQQRFRAAVASLREAKQRQAQAREKASWHALFERIKCLGELEAAMAQGEFDAALEKQVRAVWEDGTALPVIATAIDERLDATLSAFARNEPVVGSDEEQRRHAVWLEALAGLESPEADKSLRMTVQVERLAEGLGQQPTDEQMEGALRRWLVQPVAIPVDDYLALHERVETAWMNYFFK